MPLLHQNQIQTSEPKPTETEGVRNTARYKTNIVYNNIEGSDPGPGPFKIPHPTKRIGSGSATP